MKNYNVEEHTVEFYRRSNRDTVQLMIKRMKQKTRDPKLKQEKNTNMLILNQWKYIAYRLRMDKVFVFR